MQRQHAVVNQYISCQLSKLTQNLTMCKTRVKLIEIILLMLGSLTDWVTIYVYKQRINLSPPKDIVWAVKIVWRIRVKIITTVQCCIVYHTHKHTQRCSY